MNFIYCSSDYKNAVRETKYLSDILAFTNFNEES